MNLLLIETQELLASGHACVRGERVRHLRQVLDLHVGDVVRAGLVGGLVGQAQLLRIDAQEAELALDLTQTPPPPLPLTVLLALPRPKMLRRILQMSAGLGVARLVLMQTYRVEKSYWSSPWLSAAAIRQELLLGLAQARATALPEVILARRFRPFVEDELPLYLRGAQGWVAHPGTAQACPRDLLGAAVLAVGPEGGFIPFEVDLLQAQGMTGIDLGPRIQRVEWALPSLIARLF